MIPFVFEWRWDLGHFIFFGLFYAALAVIGTGLAYAFMSNLKELYSGGGHGHGHGHDHADEEAEAHEDEGEAKPAEA